MTPTLFQTLLGAAYFRLPDSLRSLHGVHGVARYCGQVTITRGAGPLSRLCGAVAGLPQTMRDAPVTVDFTNGPTGESWVRAFGAPPDVSTMCSRLWPREGRLCERLGPMEFRFELRTCDGAIFWNVVGARVFGILPLPATLFREVCCVEREIDGRYVFEVNAAMPVIGTLVQYRGWLLPEGNGVAGSPILGDQTEGTAS